MAGTIECRIGGVERQVRYVTDVRCIKAVVVGWLTGLPWWRTGRVSLRTDANHTLTGAGAEPANLDEVLSAGGCGESNL